MTKADANARAARYASTVDVAPTTRRGRRSKRDESTITIIDRLLARPVPITINGLTKRVPTGVAIVLQLLQKSMAGSGRASRALLKYRDFAASRSDKVIEITYLDSDYTRAFANSLSEDENG